MRSALCVLQSSSEMGVARGEGSRGELSGEASREFWRVRLFRLVAYRI